VLLERGFVAALVDATDPNHRLAASCYLELVDAFSRRQRRLLVTSDVRHEFETAPAGLLAPVETLHVARQEHHAAQHIEIVAADGVTSPDDMALNLVLLRRRKITGIATFDERYKAYEVEILPGFAG
jgi:predicted nucleic acid-binding protein